MAKATLVEIISEIETLKHREIIKWLAQESCEAHIWAELRLRTWVSNYYTTWTMHTAKCLMGRDRVITHASCVERTKVSLRSSG